MLKLLVTDLDGTLLKIGNELSAGISDENREALTAFVNEGGHVAIASSPGGGRSDPDQRFTGGSGRCDRNERVYHFK